MEKNESFYLKKHKSNPVNEAYFLSQIKSNEICPQCQNLTVAENFCSSCGKNVLFYENILDVDDTFSRLSKNRQYYMNQVGDNVGTIVDRVSRFVSPLIESMKSDEKDEQIQSSSVEVESEPVDNIKPFSPITNSSNDEQVNQATTQYNSSDYHYRKPISSTLMNVILFAFLFLPSLFVLSNFDGIISDGIGGYLIILAISECIYLLPTLISHSGRKFIIWILNILFGWTILGWLILLFLALDGNNKRRMVHSLDHIANK